ncbi:MAG: hypothetical protein K9I29_03605 [Bacteroidales bacterium]|nr:hypothetical protein [Bacteroidales bacterium]MCF8327358.1 hypothetical protein [Bacteroidales bacterium]
MKKIGILLLLVMFFIGSCDKIDELLTFEINHSTEVTIENNITPFDPPVSMPTPDITTNSEQSFENNNTSKDKVKDIKLKELDLSIQDPPDEDFSFLKEIYVYMSTDSTDEIQVASRTDIPEDAQSISLETTDQDLDKYVKADKYNVRTEVVTREVISSDMILDVDFTFVVTADPL